MNSLFHFTFHNQPAAWAFGSLGFRFAGGGGRWRADMASGGKGFGTKRARLAQGGFLGQFYKRNPFKRIF